MANLSLSSIVVYAGFYLFVVFVSLGVVCALYLFVELLEDHERRARFWTAAVTKATIVLNLALILDGQPPLCCLAGALAQITYHIVLSSRVFPHLEFSDPIVLCSVFGCLGSSALWLVYFLGTRYTTEYITSFMLVTSWLVPFVLSLSLAGGVESLPGGMSRSRSSQELLTVGGISNIHQSSNRKRKRHRSWVFGLFDGTWRREGRE